MDQSFTVKCGKMKRLILLKDDDFFGETQYTIHRERKSFYIEVETPGSFSKIRQTFW